MFVSLPMMEKRSVSLNGHRTSVSLEPEFWAALKAAADHDCVSVSALINAVDIARTKDGATRNLSSALRVFVLNRLQSDAP